MALVESAADVDETRLSTTQNPITSEVEMANVAAAPPPPDAAGDPDLKL